jgi:hypothetical protein
LCAFVTMPSDSLVPSYKNSRDKADLVFHIILGLGSLGS